MAITFGNVPHPPYERRIIDNPNGSDDQGSPRSNVGTCVHRMDGTLDGTDGYVRTPPLPEALADHLPFASQPSGSVPTHHPLIARQEVHR